MTDNRIHHERDDAATNRQQSPASHKPTALTRDEQDALDKAAYIECRRHGVPCRMIALRLGWSKRRAERVRQRINRERTLETHTPPEHVIGCTRFGSITPEALWFPQLAADSQSACLQTSNIGDKLFNMKADFAAQLARANSRLDELILEGTATDTLITELTIVAAKAEATAQAERETAYIESRPEKENIVRAALVAQKRLDEAKTKTRTISGSIQRQKEAITAIQADIVNNRDAGFLEEADRLRLREKLVKQATEFSELVLEIGCLGGKHGVNAFGLLHSLPYHSYPTNPDTFYIEALYQLVGAGYKFQSVQWTLTYDKTPWDKAA